jgi:hypothetical protein
MTALMDMPRVAECTIEGCSYNHDGCHAGAITIAGVVGDASCATFIPLSTEGDWTSSASTTRPSSAPPPLSGWEPAATTMPTA